MGLREKLEEKIRKKEQEAQELQVQLRDVQTYVQALQDMLKLMPRDQQLSTPEAMLRKGSSVALAKELLEKNGKAMHISDILKGIGRESNRTNRISLSGSLNAYARKGVIFTAEGQNTFGLIGSDGPPPDFGTVNPEEDEDISEDDETHASAVLLT